MCVWGEETDMDYTVRPLHCGTLRLDKSILTTQVDSGVTVPVPSICYLIEGAPEPILVDTSFGDLERMDRLHPAFQCSRSAGESLTAQLDACGYQPEDIGIVVLSHLHWDHCYNLELFPDATILAQRAEIEYAIAPYPMIRSKVSRTNATVAADRPDADRGRERAVPRDHRVSDSRSHGWPPVRRGRHRQRDDSRRRRCGSNVRERGPSRVRATHPGTQRQRL
ncbi:hypothetical protein BRC62_07025 [Halobacteriales archaeon QH_10_67_13]|nr:MAG: hypothetical protein BRC62_07025 [Halobacteriales archaeon QH_10_67_13]